MEDAQNKEIQIKPSTIGEKWKGLTFSKKILSIFLGIIGLFILLTIFTALTNLSVISTGLQSSKNYEMDSSVSVSAPSYYGEAVERGIVADYDSNTVAGTNAEDFESRDYNASIKTNNLGITCSTIENLKPLPHVIFTSANESKTNCRYHFKVTNDQSDAILSIIKDLRPEQLSQNIYTIKKQIENKLSQKDNLERNLTSIEQILSEALTSYDELLAIATAEQNTKTLATAIKDKIDLIDQLKQRREQTRQQIDSINRQLADQQDRLEYTYFSVYVYEWKYFSFDDIKESWQQEFKQLVNSANDVLQKLTLSLISFILYVILFAVYIVIALVVIRVGWKIVKVIWKS